MAKARVRLIMLLLVSIAAVTATVPLARLASDSPSSMRLINGVEQILKFRIPLSLSVTPLGPDRTSMAGSVLVNGAPLSTSRPARYNTPVRIQAKTTGRLKVDLRLFGIIPIRKMTVDVLPAVSVVPGGQAIGILLTCRGVIVVAHTSLVGYDGVRRHPAEEAGVKVGDVIRKINGEQATSSDEVKRLVAKHAAAGRPLVLTIDRDGRTMTKHLVPVLTRVEKPGGAESVEFRMGLYIEDNVAGVGTLTFYSPKDGRFAALGHVITDCATNRRIDIKGGRIVRAGISGIQHGQKGQPGEKIGTFEGSGDIAGTIVKNTEFGVYGTLSHYPVDARQAVPIAVAGQIRTGPAQMLTVLANNKVESFDVEIQKVYHQDRPQTKGLVVKVVDEKLLRMTGGIIQGMSGSPLIQDGRLIGAVTHVFVNDPSRGYGVLAEWMVIEAGLVDVQKSAAYGGVTREVV